MEISMKDILQLSIKDRLSMVEAIWDSVASETDITLSDDQKTEINRRLELYKTGRTKTYSWDEVKESMLS